MITKIIKIKCRQCNSLINYKYKIKIYDDNNCLIVNDITDELGNYYFKASYLNSYRIVAINTKISWQRSCLIVFVNKNYPDKLFIVFNKLITKRKTSTTIRLTDQNYLDLPIEKGKVILSKINK